VDSSLDWHQEASALLDRGLVRAARRLFPADFRKEQALNDPEIGDLCARLLSFEGRMQASTWLRQRLSQRFPDSAVTQAAWVRTQVGMARFDEVVRWLDHTRDAAHWPSDSLALLWETRFDVHLEFRDFFKAERAWKRAAEAGLEPSRVIADQLALLQTQDRHQDALALAEQELPRYPDSPRIAHFHAWLLFQLNREDEAMAAFAAANDRFEMSNLQVAWASALADCNREREALQVFQRTLAEFPHLCPRDRRYIHLRVAQIAARLGELDLAREHAHHSGSQAAKMLKVLEQPERVAKRLELPFQIQAHLTCAPASAASILGYFEQAIDHTEIAAQITYDGTRDTDLIEWLRGAGFVVRTFNLEAGTAKQLIDRGLPFSISLRFVTSGHRTTVIGYDQMLGRIIMLDPGSRYLREIDEDDFIKWQNARGGRALLIMPPDVAEQHVDLVLPDEERQKTSLQYAEACEHNNLDKLNELDKLVNAWPEDPMRWECLSARAWSTDDLGLRLEVSRVSVEHQPKDGYVALRHASSLQAASQHEEYRRFVASWAKYLDCPYALLVMHANLLAGQPDGRPGAWREYLRASRRADVTEVPFRELSEFVWRDPETRALALGFARIGACLNLTDEAAALRYAHLCVEANAREEGLRFLTERTERFAGKSNYPLVSLAAFHDDLADRKQAIELLQHAKQTDPRSQAWLIQEHFRHLMGAGRFDEAETLMEAEAPRLRSKLTASLGCQLARARGDFPAAIAAVEALVAEHPTSGSHWEALFELVRAQEGRLALLSLLRATLSDRSLPSEAVIEVWSSAHAVHEYSLAHQAIERAEELLDDVNMVRSFRSRTLSAEGRTEEALQAAERLVQDAPFQLSGWVDLAACQFELGRLDDARASLRRRLELGSPFPFLYDRLLQTAQSSEETQALLDEMQALLLASDPAAGDVRVVARLSLQHRPLEQVDAWLAQLAEAFPLNRPVLLARVETLAEAGRAKQAEAVARLAFEEDPDDWRMGMAFADQLQSMGQTEAHLGLVRRLMDQCPHVASIANHLGLTLAEQRKFAEAEQVFQSATRRFPGTASVFGCYASLLWDMGRADDAFTTIARACDLDSSYSWGWHTWIRWLSRRQRQNEMLEVAREHAALRPTDADACRVLATACAEADLDAEGQAALERAAQLEPGELGHTSALANWHQQRGRFEAAKLVLRHARERIGNHPRFAVAEGEILRVEGKKKQARELLRTALESSPDDVPSWNQYASWLSEDRCVDELVTLVKQVPEALRFEDWLPRMAARALEAMDRDVEALRMFERAYALDPSDESLRAELLGSRRHAEDKEGVRRMLADGFDSQTASENFLFEFAACSIWVGDAAVDQAVQALLRIEECSHSTWHRLSQLIEDKPLRKRVLAAARATSRSKDASLAVCRNAVMMHTEFGFESKQRRAVHKAQQELQTEFVTRFSTHPEFAQALSEFAGLPRGSSSKPMCSWLHSLVDAPIANSDLWGSLGYFFAPIDPEHVARLMLQDFERVDARPWMLSHLADALVSLRRDEEAELVLQRALSQQRDPSYGHLRSLEAEIHLHRGDYRWIVNHPRDRSDMKYRDRIRDLTIQEIARAHGEPAGSKRRSVYRGWLKRVAPKTIGRTKAIAFDASRDLMPQEWARTLRSPRPYLLRLGRAYTVFHLSD
jgi:tetratricopeptide (TPR) repeat protein